MTGTGAGLVFGTGGFVLTAGLDAGSFRTDRVVRGFVAGREVSRGGGVVISRRETAGSFFTVSFFGGSFFTDTGLALTGAGAGLREAVEAGGFTVFFP